MRILLLSAYDAGSHRRWREGLVASFPEYDWTVLTLPARYFSWRVRGNSLSWAFNERECLEAGYDLIVATSMVDLSALKGMVPSLAVIPTLVYFHENQFAYPKSARQHSSVEPQILNLYTALCADKIVFNSAFNRQSFLGGVDALIAKLPDQVPDGIVETLQQMSCVVPVPLEQACYEVESLGTEDLGAEDPWAISKTLSEEDRPLRLLWAARFEYDKGGDRLLLILRKLKEANVAFELAVLGERFRHSPPEFDQIEQEFAAQLVQFGFEPSTQRFRALLAGADIVLSTAIHEFQGLAVLEAVAAGCVPVLPARLAYEEYYDGQYLYLSSDDLEAEAVAAKQKIIELWKAIKMGGDHSIRLEQYSWVALKPVYQGLIQSLM